MAFKLINIHSEDLAVDDEAEDEPEKAQKSSTAQNFCELTKLTGRLFIHIILANLIAIVSIMIVQRYRTLFGGKHLKNPQLTLQHLPSYSFNRR